MEAEEAKCWRAGPGKMSSIKCTCALSDQWLSSAPRPSALSQSSLFLVHLFDLYMEQDHCRGDWLVPQMSLARHSPCSSVAISIYYGPADSTKNPESFDFSSAQGQNK